MLFYTVGQSRIFLVMLYAGLAVGLYAWLDSAARRLFEAGLFCRLIMDLLLGAAVLAIRPLLTFSSTVNLLISVAVGGVVYLALSLLTRNPQLSYLLKKVKSLI